MKSFIEFKEVSKHFQKREVLQHVSLTIHEKEILGIVGRSGSGKTTLFRLLLNIYTPTTGTILFQGKRINSKIKEKIGFASQEGSFYPQLTVIENLWYFGRMYSLPKNVLLEKSSHLLQFMQLEDAAHIKAEKLSGGMKRRLDLALALIHDPLVVVLDEPTTGLDVVLQENIWGLILKIHKSGKTIIVSSHNLSEISKYCTSFAFVTQGKVIPQKELEQYRSIGLEKLFRKIAYDQSI